MSQGKRNLTRPCRKGCCLHFVIIQTRTTERCCSCRWFKDEIATYQAQQLSKKLQRVLPRHWTAP